MINSSRFNKKIDVEEKWLDKSFDNCPFCHSKNVKKIGLIQKNPDVYLCECAECKIGYAARQPNEEFLVGYYSKYYDDQDRNTTINPVLLAKHLFKMLDPISVKRKLSILDFGGGDGSVSFNFSNTLMKEGLAKQIDITLVDFFPYILKNENENIKVTQYNSLMKVPENNIFDIIIASAILEHVKTPREILQKLLFHLKRGGFIYLRTPYIVPFFKLFKKTRINVDTHYPGHLFDMGNLFWKSSLKKLNYDNDFFLRRSQTSFPEDSISDNFLKALMTRIFKFPSRFLKYQYHLVGGWEVLIERK